MLSVGIVSLSIQAELCLKHLREIIRDTMLLKAINN